MRAVELEHTREEGGRLVGTGERFTLPADMVFKAIGQLLVPGELDGAAELLEFAGGKIVVDGERRTSLKGVWAGGDAVAAGPDLTVAAVEDGKLAAAAIHQLPQSRGRDAWPTFAARFAGVKSPNPFWLASAPPTNKDYKVVRAFEAGWGGVVWKTLGEDRRSSTSRSRYGAIDYDGREDGGFNNIELITDRAARGQPAGDQAGQAATGRTAR